MQSLPDNYKYSENRYSFQLDKQWRGKWLRSEQTRADIMNTGHGGSWESFEVIKKDNRGHHQIKNKDGNYIVCK